jgi:Cys-rich repeat protein
MIQGVTEGDGSLQRIRRRFIFVFAFCAVVGCGDDAVMDLFPSGEDAGTTTFCTSNGQCGEQWPLCEPMSHMCVECATNTDCTAGSVPVCDTRSFRCTNPCSTSTDCSGGVCDPTVSLCVECLSDTQCESGDHCLLPSGRCVRCLSDSDCSSEEGYRHCWFNQCVACNTNTDCSSGVCTVEHACAN